MFWNTRSCLKVMPIQETTVSQRFTMSEFRPQYGGWEHRLSQQTVVSLEVSAVSGGIWSLWRYLEALFKSLGLWYGINPYPAKTDFTLSQKVVTFDPIVETL